MSSGETANTQASALQLGNLGSLGYRSRLPKIASVEPGDGVGGVDEIPRLSGETRPADPADSVLQGPTELLGVFHRLDMVFGLFALHLHGRRRRYYLAGERIFGYRGKEGDRLNRVDLDIGREFQFICVGADKLLPIQLSGRPGCLDETGI